MHLQRCVYIPPLAHNRIESSLKNLRHILLSQRSLFWRPTLRYPDSLISFIARSNKTTRSVVIVYPAVHPGIFHKEVLQHTVVRDRCLILCCLDVCAWHFHRDLTTHRGPRPLFDSVMPCYLRVYMTYNVGNTFGH